MHKSPQLYPFYNQKGASDRSQSSYKMDQYSVWLKKKCIYKKITRPIQKQMTPHVLSFQILLLVSIKKFYL